MSFWRKVLATAVVGASLALVGVAEAQTVGTVTGQVTNEAGQPLPGVQIHIEGTTIGTLTNANGRYALVTVPPGTRRVIAILLGYSPVTIEVTIVADQAATLLHTSNLYFHPLQADAKHRIGKFLFPVLIVTDQAARRIVAQGCFACTNPACYDDEPFSLFQPVT